MGPKTILNKHTKKPTLPKNTKKSQMKVTSQIFFRDSCSKITSFYFQNFRSVIELNKLEKRLKKDHNVEISEYQEMNNEIKKICAFVKTKTEEPEMKKK